MTAPTFTPAQSTLLSRMLDGPVRLSKSEWSTFRNLEARGLAVKVDMLSYVTDLGRKTYHDEMERRG